ncbi:CRISPR-associated endonuclease Cas1, partial [Nitrosomonas nitrosa]|uniref:CRISPR-associated endonuclease Cas1 n=1 Tax=Nitrosomonas nitrosa TaxID=52442 RepID=UPI0023FA49F3
MMALILYCLIAMVVLKQGWKVRLVETFLLRQAQYRKAADEQFALAIAQAVIAGKLRNCRQVLLRGAREASDEDDQRELSSA